MSKGTKIINKVVDSFSKMISDLNNGIKKCEEEIDSIDYQMSNLGQDKINITTVQQKAEQFVKNLNELLGNK